MFKNHETTPKNEEVKSNFRRSIIDQRKQSALKETELFDATFGVNHITGLVEAAEELWKSYFAAGLMRKTAHDKKISARELEVLSRIPIFGYLFRYIHFYGECGDAAWSELNERAKEVEKKYKRWIQLKVVAIVCTYTNNEDMLNGLILDENSLNAFIEIMKKQGVWEMALANFEQVFGTVSDIRTSANLLSTIYVQSEDKSGQVLRDHLTSAGKRYVPSAALEKRRQSEGSFQ